MTTRQSRVTPTPASAAQASLYQQLRGHLGVLKLHDAAAHLPAVLDAATAEGLSLTAALERLLAIEVDATEARVRVRPHVPSCVRPHVLRVRRVESCLS